MGSNSIIRKAVLACGIAFAGALVPAAFTTASAAEIAADKSNDALYADAKAEGSVVVYTSNVLAGMNAVSADFMAQYPGITVEVTRIVGMQQYQRFAQEVAANQNIADIINLTDKPVLTELINSGDVARWKVPTFDRFTDEYKVEDGGYALTATIPVLIYNETKVTPEEADILRNSWAGVLDPRFKGRFAVQTQKCGLCYVGVHLFLDPANPAKLPDNFIEKVAAQEPVVYADLTNPIDRVIAGEQDFTYWSWEAIAATKRQSGAPVRFVYPDPTPVFANNYFSVSGHAPHPNAARLYMNWLASEEGAKSFQKHFNGATTLQGVKDERSFASEDWYKPVKTEYKPDFKRWGENYVSDMEKWIDAMSKK
ncbi:MAG: extracellular solute-binding protein [Rhodobiaceae bacterium]|nr:extracellular solute-binding protein [Rhodobiaceae bacterium]MCC0056612.1 extracellular solute-binding protein [Rhodobiaceae bacterium]